MLTSVRPVQFRRLLAAPHTVKTRVQVWNGDLSTLVLDDVVAGGGSVQATLASRVSRRFQIDLPPTYAGMAEFEPWGNHLVVHRGVDWGGGDVELFPVFVGRISKLRVSAAKISIEALDRANDIVKAQFLAAYTAGALRLHAEVKKLIREVIPDAAFGTFTTIDAIVPTATWEEDRAQALDDMAAVANGLWYPDAAGVFQLKPRPWTAPATPVVTLTDGVGGLLADAEYELDRENVNNAIRVLGERTDGSDPISQTIYDTDAASPWYYKGNFGLQPATIRTRLATDTGYARLIAESELRRSLSRSEQWSWTQVADPTLEVGDTVRLTLSSGVHAGKDVHQVVTGFTLPLTGATMAVSGRAHMPEGEIVV